MVRIKDLLFLAPQRILEKLTKSGDVVILFSTLHVEFPAWYDVTLEITYCYLVTSDVIKYDVITTPLYLQHTRMWLAEGCINQTPGSVCRSNNKKRLKIIKLRD